MSGEAILSAENSGKPLGSRGTRGMHRRKLRWGARLAFPRPLAGGEGDTRAPDSEFLFIEMGTLKFL